MNIILDPTLIWFSDDFSERLLYLNDIVKFIDEYLEIKYLANKQLLSIFTTLNKNPFSLYREKTILKNEIIKRILRNIDRNQLIYLQIQPITKFCSAFTKSNNTTANELFFAMYEYSTTQKSETMIFLSKDNFSKLQSDENHHIINHLYREINSFIAEIINKELYLKQDKIPKPCVSNPLPNGDLCKEYNYVRLDYLKLPHNQQIPNWQSLGKEVAFRNGFNFDTKTTNKNNNSGQIREVYISKDGNVFLSIDVEHGAIEVFDLSRTWLGEFSYDGKRITSDIDLRNSKKRKHHILL